MRKSNKLYTSEISNLRTAVDNNKKESNNVKNELNRIKAQLSKKTKDSQRYEEDN